MPPKEHRGDEPSLPEFLDKTVDDERRFVGAEKSRTDPLQQPQLGSLNCFPVRSPFLSEPQVDVPIERTHGYLGTLKGPDCGLSRRLPST